MMMGLAAWCFCIGLLLLLAAIAVMPFPSILPDQRCPDRGEPTLIETVREIVSAICLMVGGGLLVISVGFFVIGCVGALF